MIGLLVGPSRSACHDFLEGQEGKLTFNENYSRCLIKIFSHIQYPLHNSTHPSYTVNGLAKTDKMVAHESPEQKSLADSKSYSRSDWPSS